MRERGFVDALGAGQLEGQLTTNVAYRRLTNKGRGDARSRCRIVSTGPVARTPAEGPQSPDAPMARET
jgi:hypothetical protein